MKGATMPWLRRTIRPDPPAAVPSWPDENGRVRVLVENPDGLTRYLLERALRERGYAVLCCGGPHSGDRGSVSCPVMHQEHCPAIDGADVLVTALPQSRSVNRVLLRRTRAQHPELPIIVDAPQSSMDDRDVAIVDDVIYNAMPDRLAARVAELVGDRTHRR